MWQPAKTVKRDTVPDVIKSNKNHPFISICIRINPIYFGTEEKNESSLPAQV